MKDKSQLSENMSLSDKAETSHDLATHGAMLLETALSEKPANQNTDGTAARKPLSDIGNNLVSVIHSYALIMSPVDIFANCIIWRRNLNFSAMRLIMSCNIIPPQFKFTILFS